MKLFQRMLLAPGVSALAMVLCMATSFWALHAVLERFDSLRSNQFLARSMVGEVLVDVESVAAQLYRALLLYQSLEPAEQAASQKAVRDLLGGIDTRLASLRELLPEAQRAQLDDPKEKVAAFGRNAAQAFQFAAVNPAMATSLVNSAQKNFVAARLGLQAIAQQVVADVETAAAEVKSTSTASLTAILTVGALSIAASLLLAWRLSADVTRRLRRSIAVSEAISRGDLAVVITDAGVDEVGDLMRSLSDTVERLGKSIADINAASHQIHDASSEIATGSLDLSSRTEQAAASIEQTSASMEQITETVRHNSQSVMQADTLATAASEVARRGGAIVGDVVTTMGDINTSSRRIAEIIGVIDGIAFQTNILALNAAVEAARAGDQGRGFAVVASEVRNLAQRSAQAAREIKVLISDSVEKVQGGTRLVGDAGATMSEIVGSVTRLTDIIREISQSTAEQTTSIAEVGQAVGNFDQMTQQNAALVEESAAAAESLKEQAGRLAEVVGSFRLRPR
jgi:methyl-accepting chemotaxis protein